MGRHLELIPGGAAVPREENAELGPCEEQVRRHRIFGQRVDGPALGEVAGDRLPRATGVLAHEHVRFEVPLLVIVERGVHRACVVTRKDDARHVALVGHSGKARDRAPGVSAILADLDEAVVRPHGEQPFLLGALRERNDVAVERGRRVLRDGVHTVDAAHHLELVPVGLPREIAADGTPGVAAVVAAEDALRREVEPRRAVRADDQRRVPIPAKTRLAYARLRLDVDLLPRELVVADEHAVLRLGVDDVRVLRIDDRLKAVAACRDVPVGVDDAVHRTRAGRTTDRVVVLRAAVDVVERLRVVDPYLVELRERKVFEPRPRRAAVVRFVKTAVAPPDQVIGVGGVDPQDVVVHVLVLLTDLAEGLAAVLGDLHPGVHRVDACFDLGIDEELLVVLRPAGDVRAALLPQPPLVDRAEEAARLVGCFDDGIDDVGLRRSDGEADPPHVFLGEPVFQFLPRRPAVRRLPDPRTGSAVDQGPDVAASLVARGVEDVGVAGVAHDVGHSRVLVHGEDRLPRLAAVSRLVQAAVPSRRPERPLSGHQHAARIARVDEDLRDVLGILEPQVLPRHAAVVRPVDAVAVRDAALRVVLAGADPDRQRVLRVERHAADRVRPLVVEDRGPRRAGVDRLPDIPRRGRHVADRVVLRVDGDVGDAPRDHRRPYAAEGEPLELVGLGLVRLRGIGLLGIGLPGVCFLRIGLLGLGLVRVGGQRNRDDEESGGEGEGAHGDHGETSEWGTPSTR